MSASKQTLAAPEHLENLIKIKLPRASPLLRRAR